MTVQLSSLRVTAEMDVSSYTRAMAEKVSADRAGAASAKEVGSALGQLDAAARATGDVAAKLSKRLIEGYASAARFEQVVRDVGRAVDTGMSLDRAAVQLENVYRKFGLVADVTVLAQQGFVSIAPVVEQLNRHYAEQATLLQAQSEAATHLAEAAKAQAELEARVKAYTAAVDPLAIAQERFNLAVTEAEDLYTSGVTSVERYRAGVLKAQQALDLVSASVRKAADAQAAQSQSWFNNTLNVKETFSTTDRGADMEAALLVHEKYTRQLIREREAESDLALARAQAAQSSINASIGIREDSNTAKRAADIDAWSRAYALYTKGLLEARQAEEALARVRAQSVQAAINTSLDVRDDFGSDSRAKDIEAWSRELDRYYSNLLRVREAEEQVARERIAANQQAINTNLGVSTPMGEAAYAARASEYETLGQSIDNLRAKYDPLYAAERKHAEAIADINRLYAMGELEADRYADVTRRANAVHEQTTLSLKRNSAEIGLNKHQWTNFSYQINDVATMLLSGSSPFQVLATQGGQVLQIMQSGEGGVVGSLKGMGTALLGLLTPTNLVIGGLAALGVAAGLAYLSWLEGQAEVERSLLGIGRASGATVGQINAVAEAYANAGHVSQNAAREMASAFAATGRISPELFGDLIASAKNFGKIVGQDGSAAAGTLAKALADPVRGAEQLNATLGAFDAGTLRRIQSLDAQNRVTDAQRLMIDGIRSATEGAERATTSWSKTWDSLGQSISNVWAKLGRAIDVASGGGTVEQQKTALDRAISQLEQTRAAQEERLAAVRSTSLFGFQTKDDEAALEAINRKLQDLRSKAQGFADDLAKAASEAARIRQNLDSIRAMGEIKIVMPELDVKRALADRASYLGGVAEDPVMLKALGLTQDQVNLAAARAKEMSASYMSAQDLAVRQGELANKAITARSPAERASIAAEQKRLELVSAALSPEEKRVQIEAAYANALKEGNVQLSDSARTRLLAIQDQIGATEVEIAAIGKTAAEAELLRLNWQAYADLRREAAQNNTSIDIAQLERLKKENEELVKRKTLLAERTLENDLGFERRQFGRSDIEQRVASTMKTYGLGEDMDSYTAGIIRLNQYLSTTKDIGGEFFSSFSSSIRGGATAVDALNDSLGRVADRLLNMATDQIWSGLFKSSTGLLSTLGLGGGSAAVGVVGGAGPMSVPTFFADGGPIVGPGSGTSDSIVARVSNGEYVVRADKAARYRSLLDALNFGPDTFPRFASGGMVNGGAAASLPIAPNMIVNVTNNAQAEVSKVEAKQTSDGLRLDVVIDQLNAKNISKPGSASQNAFKSTFGARNTVVRR